MGRYSTELEEGCHKPVAKVIERVAIPFEAEVEADKVEARFKNGLLTVTLPKSPRVAEKTRQIEIRPH